ncbi:uncharacterized protein LOC106639528 [Copidosoma floridanum]|uniref:uncharacterized protein LOC106639528 n=1 Tax=Copidosoma floridanum TaxID=29053 RepID=UPI0006C957BB|nr:uncharacterized protein LOC106639528 [Copidosoma floridanum]
MARLLWILVVVALHECQGAPGARGGAATSDEGSPRAGLEFGPLPYALRFTGGQPQQQQGQLVLEPREGRSSGMGSSFIRYGRDIAVSQPHTRSDIIIRYGRGGAGKEELLLKRDELNNRLARLRQERMQRLARLALVCANKSQEDLEAPSSAEDRIIREMCRDAPLHPTVPDFV